MKFEKTQAYLLSLGNEVSAMKLGLENIHKLLKALGSPQNKYLKVQVAGTNGKGSVCAFLDSICNTAGIKTGTFTSPHLMSITERIRIGGADISETDFARHGTRVRDISEMLFASGELESIPTFFEQVTTVALVAFAEANVELAILETGLGGRLDATTAANAEIAAITRIDIDHQEYLGDTIEEIAAEKAAIVHAGSKVVIGEQRHEAMEVISNRCKQFGIVPRTECVADVLAINMNRGSAVMCFATDREVYHDPDLGLVGIHQVENARIAVMLSEILRFDYGYKLDRGLHVVEGLEAARHPGRLEYDGRFLFDGAHNVAGAQALADFVIEFEHRPITLVFGAMNDKSVAEIGDILFPLATTLVLTRPDNSRAMAPEEIARTISIKRDPGSIRVASNVRDALLIAFELTPSNGIILVSGSLYLIGEAKQEISNLKFEI